MSDNASNPTASGPGGMPQVGMPCPRCRVDLLMTERQGVEIDYCPKCRGVWLDRGELDKIIERNAQYMTASPLEAPSSAPPVQSPWTPGAAPPSPQPGAPPPGWGQGYDHGHGGGHGGGHDGGHGGGHGGGHDGDSYRRRGHNSFLGRLFD